MKIQELITHQRTWESDRGIKNPNHNLERTQVELDEAKNELDPLKRLVEYIDVLIIASGGMAKLVDELGLKDEDVSKMIESKLDINVEKYPEESFYGITTSWAITRCRYMWSINPDEFLEGGEYY